MNGTTLTTQRALALASVVGLVALLLGWVLLTLGRSSDEPGNGAYRPVHIEAGPMLHLAEVLSSDALQGRAAGTAGNEAARGFIRKRFEEIGLKPYFETGWQQPVPILPAPDRPDPLQGANLVGWVPGATPREGPFILLTAHFDHLGVRNGEIYNGADDNASGVAALVAIAGHFVRHPPTHDIVFAALDAEEIGFLGARALIRDPAFDVGRVGLNINLDMVSRSESGELYAAGTYHTPALGELVAGVASTAPVTLLIGHDRPEDGPSDWTSQSDHAVFHEAGIPFLYFGVEDHPGYHQPSDDFSAITPDFYVRAADTLVEVILAADASLPQIATGRRAPRTSSSTEGTPE